MQLFYQDDGSVTELTFEAGDSFKEKIKEEFFFKSTCPASSSDISPAFYSRLRLEPDGNAFEICANDPGIKKQTGTWFITENYDNFSVTFNPEFNLTGLSWTFAFLPISSTAIDPDTSFDIRTENHLYLYDKKVFPADENIHRAITNYRMGESDHYQ